MDSKLLAAAIRDNPAAHLLKRLGYRTFVISSGFDHLAERDFGEDLGTSQLSELEAVLLDGQRHRAVGLAHSP